MLLNLFSHSFIISLRQEWMAEKTLTWSLNFWSMDRCRNFFSDFFLVSPAFPIFLAPLLTAVFHSIHHWGNIFKKGKKQQQAGKAEAIRQICLGPPTMQKQLPQQKPGACLSRFCLSDALLECCFNAFSWLVDHFHHSLQMCADVSLININDKLSYKCKDYGSLYKLH